MPCVVVQVEDCPSYQPANQNFPERELVFSLLLRAVRDLEPQAGHLATRSAIAWFYNEYDGNRHIDARFTFKQVIEYLELTDKQVYKIMQHVRNAEGLPSTWKRPNTKFFYQQFRRVCQYPKKTQRLSGTRCA